MTDEEKFLVDLQGYLLIKNVLSTDEVAELNALADEKFAYQNDGKLDRRTRCSTWGKPTQNLMDHPKIVPYLTALIDEKFRLDHDYCIFMREGAGGGGLHGGEGHEGDHWYKFRHDGKIRNGLCVITYFLAPARAGDGGFLCVPGSHKSNVPNSLPGDVRGLKRRPHYVIQPEVEAGDALFFTEALIHGTAPWTASHERRALLYKFSPGHSAWSQHYPSAADYTDLTEQQKRILEPPSVGSRRDVV
ncbi:phytanoyl-CoA dioxygenase family protein [Armatimonas sp.]|uniref:phytanoyl-CoA dioxygenase family protein n=1 Tax=Armatimonas sp. TaxID=1872638 RepID=UPI003752C10A